MAESTLVRWLEQIGASVSNLRVAKTVETERGTFLTRDILRAGDPVLSIPRAGLLCENDATAALLELARALPSERASANAKLALLAVRDRRLLIAAVIVARLDLPCTIGGGVFEETGAACTRKFDAYYDSLPQEVGHIPLNWAPAELELLTEESVSCAGLRPQWCSVRSGPPSFGSAYASRQSS